MKQTTNVLKLTFLSSAHKKTSLSLPDAAADLDQATVKEAMVAIAQENIFSKEGVDLYQQPESAEYVTRTVKPVFSAKEDSNGDAE